LIDLVEYFKGYSGVFAIALTGSKSNAQRFSEHQYFMENFSL